MTYNKGKGKGIAFIRANTGCVSDECVLWPYSVEYNGYGHFGYNGKLYRAHKFMCELVHGPSPLPELEASHSCGVAACINPRHLSWETHSENEKRKREHGTIRGGAKGPEGNGGSRTYLTKEQIDDIRSSKGKVSADFLAEKYGLKRGGIRYWQDSTHDPVPRSARPRARISILG